MFLQFRAAAAGVVHIYHEEVYMLCYSIWISSYRQWFSNIKRYKNHLGSVPVKKVLQYDIKEVDLELRD